MKELNDNELAKVEGGMTVAAGIGIALLVTFVAGILDGQTKP